MVVDGLFYFLSLASLLTLILVTVAALWRRRRRLLARGAAAAAGRRSLKGRNILITGCDSGFGFSLALWCAKEGMNVLAACLQVLTVKVVMVGWKWLHYFGIPLLHILKFPFLNFFFFVYLN